MITALWAALVVSFVFNFVAVAIVNGELDELKKDFELDKTNRINFVKSNPLAQSLGQLRANFGILLIHLGLKWSNRPGANFVLEKINPSGNTDGKAQSKPKKVTAKK